MSSGEERDARAESLFPGAQTGFYVKDECEKEEAEERKEEGQAEGGRGGSGGGGSLRKSGQKRNEEVDEEKAA